MEIAELDPRDLSQARQLFSLRQAVHEADRPDSPPPLWESVLAKLQHHPPELRFAWHTVLVGGEPVGNGVLALPEIDNRHLAVVHVEVHPAYRRRGVGRALLERLHQRIDDERRRTVLSRAVRPVSGGPPRSDNGARFLVAMGYSAALETVQRRIDLAAIDEVAEQRLLEECLPHAAGYERLTWTGLTPDEHAGGVARLANRVVTDAPRGEMAVDATTMDAQRLHADERSLLEQQVHLAGAAARHLATGTLAAVTRIDVRSAGDYGMVWLTIADPRHRGHRLGTIVKLDAHRLARQTFPDLRYVSTGNADANAQITAINERLGYVAYEAVTNYQLVR